MCKFKVQSLFDTHILQSDYHHSLANTCITSHNYHFFFVVRLRFTLREVTCFLYVCFSPLECKPYEERDHSCLIHCHVFPVLRTVCRLRGVR